MSKSLIICILEDDEAAIEIIKSSFRVALPDCVIKIATDGRQILRILAKLPPPDLVILDVMTPLLDGFQVLSIVRKQKEVDWMPIVMFSTDDSIRNVAKATELGANGFFLKPPESQMVETLIEMVTKFSYKGPKPLKMPVFLLESDPMIGGRTKSVDELMGELL
jgi:DNA-binding response OmpR family regulator